MGKIRENMDKLVGQVRSSAAARHRGVANIRLSTREPLAQNRGEGEDRRERLAQKARALSSGLAEEREKQLRGAGVLKTALGRASQSRRSAVGELRGRVRTVMGAIAKDVAEAGRLWRTTGPARRK